MSARQIDEMPAAGAANRNLNYRGLQPTTFGNAGHRAIGVVDDMEMVLLLHAGALGDCALILHVVLAMKGATAGLKVSLASRSALGGWARRRGLVDESRSLDSLALHRLFDATAAPPDVLVTFLQSFDRVVSFLGPRGDPPMARLSECLGDRLISVDPRPTDRTLRQGIHITRQWAEQLADHGLPLILPEKEGIILNGSIGTAGPSPSDPPTGGAWERTVLCHPGSGGLHKCCPREALEQLLQTLETQAWSVAWMIGPDEMERFGPPYQERLQATAGVHYEESADVAADLVCTAKAFIGHDAGMTHVAALAGVPTVAIFGPTDPRVWRPLGPACTVVGFPDPGAPLDRWVDSVVTALREPVSCKALRESQR